jgi:hypothetical protein
MQIPISYSYRSAARGPSSTKTGVFAEKYVGGPPLPE